MKLKLHISFFEKKVKNYYLGYQIHILLNK